MIKLFFINKVPFLCSHWVQQLQFDTFFRNQHFWLLLFQIEKIEEEKQAKENENIEQKKEVTISSESEVKYIIFVHSQFLMSAGVPFLKLPVVTGP